LPHATKAQAIAALKGHASNIASWISGAQEMHRSLARRNADSGVAGFVSEGMATTGEEVHDFWAWTKSMFHGSHGAHEKSEHLDSKVRLPGAEVWDMPLNLLHAARQQLQAGEIEEAIARLNDAARAYRRAYQLLREYKERTEAGAASAITALQVAEAAGAISFSVLTGGAGSGLVGTAVMAGVGAGGYAAAQATAGQASEKAHGLRERMDWKEILKHGAEEAVTNFAGALVGGALSKYFLRKLGEKLLFRLGKEEIAALAARARLSGDALHPELFVSKGWAFVAHLAGGVGSSPVVTAVATIVHGALSGEWPKTREDFVHRVVDEMIQGAFFQVLLGAVTHGRGAPGEAKSGRNGSEGVHKEFDPRVAKGDPPPAPPRPEPAASEHDPAQHSSHEGSQNLGKGEPTQTQASSTRAEPAAAKEPTRAATSEQAAAEQDATTERQPRVTEAVGGHYEGIDIEGVPHGWKIVDERVRPNDAGVVIARTEVLDPAGRRCVFMRRYDPQTKQLVMEAAFLHPDSPRWVTHEGQMMTSKGTPSQSYWTMRQMRKMGIAFGEVQKVKMSTIQNVETILQLERAKLDGRPLEAVLPTTASVKYANTPLTQSGGRIVPGSVKKTPGKRMRLGDLLAALENSPHYGDARKIQYAKLLEKYGFARDAEVEFDFNITFDIAPTTSEGS